VEVVSFIICESTGTQFSVRISESSGTMCVDESRRQLGKQCR
jgi:hypothetical protein